MKKYDHKKHEIFDAYLVEINIKLFNLKLKLLIPAFLIFILFASWSLGQTNKDVRLLELKLGKADDNRTKIGLENSLSAEMLYFDLSKAVNYSRDAYRLSLKENNPNLIAESSLSLGNAYYFSGMSDSCYCYLNTAREIYSGQNNIKGLAKVYNSLGNFYKDRYNTDSAFYFFNRAISIAEKIKNDEILATGYLNLGAMYANQLGDFTKAEEFTITAMDIIKPLNNNTLLCQAYFNLGVIRREIGDDVKAEEFFLKVLDFYREKGYTIKQINVYLKLGSLFYSVDNYEKSRHYFTKLLDLSIGNNYKPGIAAAYHNIASILQHNGEIDTAINYYLKASEINIEIKNNYWLSNNYAQLAVCFSDKNDFDKAYQNIRKSAGIDISRNDSSALAESYSILGEIHLKNNFTDSAMIYLNKSNAIAAEYGGDYLLSENYGLLSEIYVIKSDYNKAFACLKQSREINDSLSSLETVQLVEELEIKYNVKQKDLELEKNKSTIENLENINKIKKIRIGLLVIICFTITFLSILIFILLRIRHKRKTEKLIFEKQIFEINAELKEKELQKATLEISHQTGLILEKNRIITDIKEELYKIKDSGTDLQVEKISNLLSSRIIIEEQWIDFKEKFEEVHPDFIAKLRYRFGKLTDAEVRMACLIKLNINNKDIGTMLGISTESVIKSKYRFRKRINLTDSSQLDDIITEL